MGVELTLIKSVLNSLPTYYFSLFKTPSGVIDELEKMRHKFIWGGDDTKHKIHWVSWDRIVASRKKGGLGVRSLRAQNLSLLTKWWWRLKIDKGNLWKECINNIHNLKRKPITYIAKKNPFRVYGAIIKRLF